MTDTAPQSERAARRRQRADGRRTRNAILRVAVATIDGLEGLSIGNLAAALDMSKSGLYAHFGLDGPDWRPSTRLIGSSRTR